MRRLTDADYSIDAVTAAKALLGAWLCRRLDDGTVICVYKDWVERV
jgi:3-methyladenine DNA glycosylase Mpg